MKKILVPCDFTDTSENALSYAIGAAVSLSADLVLVHINHYPVVTPEIGLSSYTYQDSDKDSIDALEKLRLRIINERHFTGKIECFSEMGDTAGEIEKYAREQMADLIIMGISGYKNKMMKNLIGSSAVSVGKHSEIPVLIVPPVATYKKPEVVIYACEYEEQILIEPGFLKVKEICDMLGARVHLLHVIEENTHGQFPVNTSYTEHHATGDLKTFIIHEKHAAGAILNFLKDHAADIIAIHPHKHTFFERIFRQSVTSEIAFNSPVPVLTVH